MLRTGIDCKGKEYTEFPKELPNGKDITGQVFGELTVLFRIENEKRGLVAGFVSVLAGISCAQEEPLFVLDILILVAVMLVRYNHK